MGPSSADSGDAAPARGPGSRAQGSGFHNSSKRPVRRTQWQPPSRPAPGTGPRPVPIRQLPFRRRGPRAVGSRSASGESSRRCSGRAARRRTPPRARSGPWRRRTWAETRPLDPPSLPMTDFSGKFGLVVGVANKRSIAWAIAQATARRGARLALTYQGRFEDHVRELSQGLEQPPLVLPCDVTSDAEIDAVFAKIQQEFGGLDFLVHGAAFAPPDELKSPFVNTSRDGFRMTMDISVYSLIALARGAVPM